MPSSYANRVSEVRAWLYVHNFLQIPTSVYTPRLNINENGAVGIRIAVHPRKTFPRVNQGFDVSPGVNLVLNLKADQYTRLSQPYEACTHKKHLTGNANENEDESETEPVFGLTPRYLYTAEAAKLHCYQEETIEACGCFSPYLPITNDIPNMTLNVNIDSCLRVNGLSDTISKINCFSKISYGERCDSFEPLCEEVVYSYDEHASGWPMDGFKMAFYKEMLNNTHDYLPERHLKFRDYFNAFDTYDVLLENNTSIGMAALREDELIERNFIQLKVRFQVNLTFIFFSYKFRIIGCIL